MDVRSVICFLHAKGNTTVHIRQEQRPGNMSDGVIMLLQHHT
jgi:hypothetical protein